MALIILLDQFPRNMFRNNAGSFASDEIALQVAIEATEKGFDLKYTSPLERSLVYLPFMHSENIEIHDKYSIPKHEALAREFPSFQYSVKYAHDHANIIRKWGRYPHRNEILGRVSTEEEILFLQEPGSRF